MIRMTWPEYCRSEALWKGRHVRLSDNQREVLSTLLINRGRPLSVSSLIEAVWPDPDEEPDSAQDIIKHNIHILRVKFGGLIRTAVRHGYGWIIDA